MTEQEKLVEAVKREASISLIASLAKAMGAKVIIYNPAFGEFALKMDPMAVDFFGIESVVQALGGVQ
jgi:hypothetical protein